MTDIQQVADRVIDETLRRLMGNERVALAEFVVYLAEFDQRRLYLGAGCSSVHAWLTEHLRLANASAYRRITAARLQARMPVIASYLRDGRMSLTKLAILKDVLQPDDCVELLDRASALSERDVEVLAVARNPERAPAAPRDTIRPVTPRPPDPAPTAGDLFAPRAPSPTPAPPPAPVRHQITMTVGPEFLAQLEEIRAALSHSHPNANLETLLGECMKVTLAQHRRRVEAETDRPRPQRPARKWTRNIPAEVRRIVWKRDGRRCTFVSKGGHRCTETHRLQIHHDEMACRGGPATVTNCRVVCQSHNLHLAREELGDRFMDQFTPG